MIAVPPLHAPNTPTLPELNAQALAGNMDAARRLAAVSSTCKTAWEFVELYVPADEALHVVGLQADGAPYYVFDLYYDAFVWSRTPGALRETVELPVIESKETA